MSIVTNGLWLIPGRFGRSANAASEWALDPDRRCILREQVRRAWLPRSLHTCHTLQFLAATELSLTLAIAETTLVESLW